MSSAHDQGDFARISRLKNLKVVPNNQQKLLGNDASWSHVLQQNGVSNIPRQVMDDLVAAEKKRKAAKLKLERLGVSDPAREIALCRRSPSPIYSNPSPPEERMSWSPSPERRDSVSSQRSKAALAEPEDFNQDAAGQAPVVTEDEPPPRGATPTVSPVPIEGPLPLQSSYEEEELETELPQGRQSQVPFSSPPQAQSSAPSSPAARSPSPARPPSTNRNPQSSAILSPSAGQTALTDTPPCAQPSQAIIPGTVLSENQRMKQPITRRSLRPILFRELQDDGPGHLSTSYGRMANTKTYTQIASQVDSSNSTTSSGIIRATQDERITTQPARRSPILAPDQPAATVPQHEDASSAKQPTPSPVAAEPEPSARPESEQAEQRITPLVEPMETDQTATYDDLAPYELFTKRYPSYEVKHRGTFSAYIKACICLEFMRTSMSLRDYLWDDFIRSFSSGYQGYVERTGDKALGALQWFNNLDGRPAYDLAIVNRSNLDFIINSYPEEFAELRALISSGNHRQSRTTAVRQQSPPRAVASVEPIVEPVVEPQSEAAESHTRQDPEIPPQAQHCGSSIRDKPAEEEEVIVHDTPDIPVTNDNNEERQDTPAAPRSGSPELGFRDASIPPARSINKKSASKATPKVPSSMQSISRKRGHDMVSPTPRVSSSRPASESVSSSSKRVKSGKRPGGSYFQSLNSRAKDGADPDRKDKLQAFLLKRRTSGASSIARSSAGR